MIVGNEILKYRDKIIEDTCGLIRIPSVMDLPEEGKPFGKNVYRALEYVLNLGSKMGFETKNIDGYAGHVEYGEGKELVGALVHLDVVPAGNDWTFPPFGGEIHEGNIYGRGASDNKGPAVATLYALKALKDLNMQINKKVRIIFGTNEENGMKCMEYYFEREPVPDYGFSPDAGYPIYNREKGIMQLNFTTSVQDMYKKGKIIKWIRGGNATNMVPDNCEAYAVIDRLSEKLPHFIEWARQIPGDKGSIKFSQEGEQGCIIRTTGKSAHGAAPDGGVNAVSLMIDFLQSFEADFCAGDFIRFLFDKIGYDTTGKSLGILFEDKESGSLTLNLGTIKVDNETIQADVDIRYPVTISHEDILQNIGRHCADSGINMNIKQHIAPLYVPETHRLISRLSLAYEKITKEKAELLSMGGGTYARALKNNGVAFGAGFPGTNTRAHQPDEFIPIDDLMRHGVICTQALWELTRD